MLRRVFAANVVYDGDMSRRASRETGRYLYHESPITPRRIIIPRQVYRDEMVSRESCPWTPSCRALVLKNKKRRTPVLADTSIPAGASGARTQHRAQGSPQKRAMRALHLSNSLHLPG